MSECLSQDLIDRFLNKGCSPEERQQIEAHLRACPACRHRVRAGQPTLADPDSGLWRASGSGGGAVPQASGFPASMTEKRWRV